MVPVDFTFSPSILMGNNWFEDRHKKAPEKTCGGEGGNFMPQEYMNGYGFHAEEIYGWGVFQTPAAPLFPP